MKQVGLFVFLFFFLSFSLFPQNSFVPVERYIGKSVYELERVSNKAKYQESRRNGTTIYVWVKAQTLHNPLNPDDQWLSFCKTHAIVNKYSIIIDYFFIGNACL